MTAGAPPKGSLENPLQRLAHPPLLRVDFTAPYWNISRRYMLCWVALVVASDLVVQWAVASLEWWTAGASFLALLLLGGLPPRLGGALAGLYVTQALVSLVLLVTLLKLQAAEPLIHAVTMSWQGWCLIALVVLVLRYIRTPMRAMR